MRGGNQLADYFANMAIEKRNYTFTEFNIMEAKGKTILNSDKLNSLYLRFLLTRK